MHQSKSWLAMLAILGAALAFYAAPSKQMTKGTAAEWQALCQSKAYSCVEKAEDSKAETTIKTYLACGQGMCFDVTCDAATPQSICVKEPQPSIKPPPRKLQTVVGSLL